MVQAYGLATPPPCRRPDRLALARLSKSEAHYCVPTHPDLWETPNQLMLLEVRPPNHHRQNASPQAKCLDQALTQNLPQWPTLPGNPPSLKVSQTHPRVGHTLNTLWPRGSTHTAHAHPSAMLWLVAA